MTLAPLWQHVLAIVCALGAFGWLLRRSLRGVKDVADAGAPGPCAHCPARKGGPIEKAVLLRKRQAPREPA